MSSFSSCWPTFISLVNFICLLPPSVCGIVEALVFPINLLILFFAYAFPPSIRRLSSSPSLSHFFLSWQCKKFVINLPIDIRCLSSVKIAAAFMNSVMVSRKCCFSNAAFSTHASSLSWNSFQFWKPISPKPDPPTESSTTSAPVQKKTRYISHENAIQLIKHERDPQHALEIFNMVSEQKGFNHNHATYATILHKLGRSKKFQAIDAVLHQMTYETCKFHEIIFLNLMKHFSKSSLHERVLDMFYAIQSIVRDKPSVKAISTCLNLLVESDKMDLARKLLLHSRKKLGLKPNTCIYNILVKYHCKRGDIKSAFEVIKEMEKSKTSFPNLITYSTLIGGLCASGRLNEAIELFEKMISVEKIIPDVLTYNVLINGFCRKGKVDQARKIMEYMKSTGCNPNIFNYSSLMNGLCKEGRIEDAKKLFNEMKSFGMKPDTVGYTTLINSLCRTGGVNEAMALLREMKEKECKADTVTFNVILGGLCGEGRSAEALDMLENLPYEGIYLDKASYRIVLNFLTEKGELKKAIELLSLMLYRGFVPHHGTSNQLLISLCEAKMVEDAALSLIELLQKGFTPNLDSWSILVDLICRERRLLPAFELLDELVTVES